MRIDAVVLAGRENTGKLSGESSEKYEANIDIAGKPMVAYILGALQAVSRVGDIYLVGPKEGLARYESERVKLVEPGDSLFDNVKIGLDRANTEFVLVSASDVPLVTSRMIDEFLDQCLATGADFCYPVSEKADCERAFPGVKRTYVTLREGTFTGGNIFFVRKSIAGRTWSMVEKMIEYRKDPLKMASVLGLGLLVKLMLKTAGVSEIERRVGDLLMITPKAILRASPEIGVDVDKPSDLELCRRILGK